MLRSPTDRLGPAFKVDEHKILARPRGLVELAVAVERFPLGMHPMSGGKHGFCEQRLLQLANLTGRLSTFAEESGSSGRTNWSIRRSTRSEAIDSER